MKDFRARGGLAHRSWRLPFAATVVLLGTWSDAGGTPILLNFDDQGDNLQSSPDPSTYSAGRGIVAQFSNFLVGGDPFDEDHTSGTGYFLCGNGDGSGSSSIAFTSTSAGTPVPVLVSSFYVAAGDFSGSETDPNPETETVVGTISGITVFTYVVPRTFSTWQAVYESQPVDTITFSFGGNFQSGDGWLDDVTIQAVATSGVPEPSGWLPGATSALGLLLRVRRVPGRRGRPGAARPV